MALEIGNETATFGMSKAIYDALSDVMEPIDGVEGDALEEIRNGWRKLAFAVAGGVVTHIAASAEVYGVTTGGDIEADVVGAIASQEGVTFTQAVDAHGRVR